MSLRVGEAVNAAHVVSGRYRRIAAASWVLALVLVGSACLEESSASRSIAVSDNTSAKSETVMPDVVCMDLQDAQDLIQERGVFLSRSVDATGQGRTQIRDSNWVVVSQTPPAGSPIDEGDAELAVVKDGEPSVCDAGAGEEAAAAPPSTIPTTTPAPSTTIRPTTTTQAPTTTTVPPTTVATTTATTTTQPPPPPTTQALQPLFPTSDCDPNYEGGCVPLASDVDCAGGSGNGPEYVRGPVRVVGNDIYGLDRDGDGYGCES